MYDEYDDRHDRIATESEAHAEWHRNAGVPMGTPGCPWDACHDDYPDDYDGPTAPARPLPLPDIDPDDIPF